MQSNKIVEKFAYLKDVGEGLFHRLYFSRFYFLSERARPAWLKDQQAQKVLKPLLAKFPEFPDTDKIQGYEILTSKAKSINDDLEQHYETFVDCADWKDAALGLLTEIANMTVSLKIDENPVITTLWLDLAVQYARLHVLASAIPDRKLVLGVYYKMFYHIRSAAEPNYQHAAKWAYDFDLPFRKIQDEFRAINDAMGKALMSLMMPYMKSRTINSLRKEGALNITLKPEEMTKPAMDQARLDLANASKMYLWTVYGLLCTPGVFALPGSIELAKFALAEGWQTPVFKDITVALYPDYEYLFNNYKTKTLQLSKQKKVIKEAASLGGVVEAGRRHLERRIYVRQELEALYHLFCDKPALLGPKMQILWAALSLAKEEIFWYFRHSDTIPPDKLKKNYKAEDFKDKRISSLIHYIHAHVAFANQHRRVIMTYYLEYMAGADLASLSTLLDQAFYNAAGPVASQYAQSILQDLQAINIDQWNTGSAPVPMFQTLRENWLRLEVYLSTPGTSAPLLKYKNLCHRFNMICAHSKNVDSLDDLFEEYSDLRNLWYHKDAIYGIPPPPPPPGGQPAQGVPGLFDVAITDGPDQPLHAISFLRLLGQFPGAATQYWPEEREMIGRECVDMAHSCLTKISSRVVTILNTVASQYIQSEYQLAEANAAVPLLQKRKDWKPPSKDWVPPQEPGSESSFKNRQNLDTLRLYQRNANQLCTALNEVFEIIVYDQVFVPREFLREKMASTLRTFVRKAVATPSADGLIQRPSILELQVRVYVHVFSGVENFLDIDVGDLLREVLLGETHAKVMGKLGKVDWFPEGDVDFEGGIGGVLAMWYSDFIAKRLQTGVCYSPLRQGFVTRAGVPFRAEEYADIVELKALARMVGPYGVKLVERELLRFILSNIATIREAVVANVAPLEEILLNFHKEAKCTESLRKLRDVDNFIAKSIAVGNALALRRLLKSALNQVAQDEIPYITNSVDAMFNQYPPNVFMFPDLLLTDTLALDLGIAPSTSDQSLKVILKKATNDADKKLWELLPVLYACSFATSSYWKDAQFRPYLEGHLNNAHSLIYAINDLITAFSSITFTSGNVEDIAALQLRFVEISSVILLRMARSKDKHSPNDYPSVVIFIDRFVQECPLLTEDMLERSMPYTLLRNMYKQIYEDKQAPGGKQAETTQDGGF